MEHWEGGEIKSNPKYRKNTKEEDSAIIDSAVRGLKHKTTSMGIEINIKKVILILGFIDKYEKL